MSSLEISKNDVDSFFLVLDFLKEAQSGAFGIGKSYHVDLRFLKYVGIGEGMDYESGEDYDFDELRTELLKVVNESSKEE